MNRCRVGDSVKQRNISLYCVFLLDWFFLGRINFLNWFWFEYSLTPHSTQYRSFRRRSSQPITWLILTNKTVQENTVDNVKYSKTKLPWFSCLLQHSATKRGGLILQRRRAHTALTATLVCHFTIRQPGFYLARHTRSLMNRFWTETLTPMLC